MSNASALIAVIGITAFDVALVVSARTIGRGPFPAIGRWLSVAWNGVYRATGAARLDAAIARRSASRRAVVIREVLAIIPADPQFDESRAQLGKTLADIESF